MTTTLAPARVGGSTTPRPTFRHSRSSIATSTSSLNRTTSTLAASFSSSPAPPHISLPVFDSTDEEEDDIEFPAFEVGCSSEGTWDNSSDTPTDPETDTFDSPDSGNRALDDSVVKREPARQIDYLSHRWKPEDAIHSYHYVVAQKRDRRYDETERLKNATLRGWYMATHKIQRIPPEIIRWHKDNDIVWLFAPLQTQIPENPKGRSYNAPSPSISVSSSVARQKSILKKKPISQTLLQHSLSTNTLLLRASAIINAQTKDRNLETSSEFSFQPDSDSLSSMTYASSATSETPSSVGRRHISFNNIVEQRMIVDRAMQMDGPSVGCVKEHLSKSRPSLTPRGSFSSFTSDSSTIAPLPSTTLKNCPPISTPRENKIGIPLPWFSSQSAFRSGSNLSRSSSTDTVRPPKDSNNFLLGEEDHEDNDASWLPKWGESAARFDSSWFGGRKPPAEKERSTVQPREPAPYNRSSGVFIPVGFDPEGGNEDMEMDEDEEFRMNYGLFGKVIDSVNTARDIAHVIWNVGWS